MKGKLKVKNVKYSFIVRCSAAIKVVEDFSRSRKQKSFIKICVFFQGLLKKLIYSIFNIL
jgi:hypothetical protein